MLRSLALAAALSALAGTASADGLLRCDVTSINGPDDEVADIWPEGADLPVWFSPSLDLIFYLRLDAQPEPCLRDTDGLTCVDPAGDPLYRVRVEDGTPTRLMYLRGGKFNGWSTLACRP